MSANEDTGWDGGYEQAVDAGELGELMLGPYQRYDTNGEAAAHRWGSRYSIHTRRHATHIDNMAALDGVAGIADGRSCDTSGLRPETGWAGGSAGEDSVFALLREHVVARLAEVFGHPAAFMRYVLFDHSPLRAAGELDLDDVHAMRSLYQQDLEIEAAQLGIALPHQRAHAPVRPAPLTCTACLCVISDGRCRCS